MTKFKLGRKPRGYSPSVPHYSALVNLTKPNPIPVRKNWLIGMPDELGEMLNNDIGCCTSSAFFHARQVWNYNTTKNLRTDPDVDVLTLYEAVSGYNSSDQTTDQGALCQDVLQYLLNTGAPIRDGTRDKILGFVEVDHRILDDVKRTIFDCGVCYVGFNVPSYLMPANGEPPFLWNVEDPNAEIIGGHAIVLCGFDSIGFDVISWGKKFMMTPRFLAKYVDECYAIIDKSWIEKTGNTPLGMTVQFIEQQMEAMRPK